LPRSRVSVFLFSKSGPPLGAWSLTAPCPFSLLLKKALPSCDLVEATAAARAFFPLSFGFSRVPGLLFRQASRTRPLPLPSSQLGAFLFAAPSNSPPSAPSSRSLRSAFRWRRPPLSSRLCLPFFLVSGVRRFDSPLPFSRYALSLIFLATMALQSASQLTNVSSSRGSLEPPSRHRFGRHSDPLDSNFLPGVPAHLRSP